MRPLALTTPPAIVYPFLLRAAGITGDVVVDVLVDSAGQIEPDRTRVVSSSHSLFTAAVRNGYLKARWDPGMPADAPRPGIWRDTIYFDLLSGDSARCGGGGVHRRRICASPVDRNQQIREVDDDARRRWRDTLAVGRARWRSAAPRAYRLEITQGCFCFGALSPTRIVVEVRDGRIARQRRTVAPPARSVATMQGWRSWTIDSLFTAAEGELTEEGRFVAAFELDPTYGFPRRVHTDVRNVTDSWSRLDVRSFVPLH